MSWQPEPRLEVGDKVYHVYDGCRVSGGPFTVDAERKFKYRRNVKINGEWYSDDGFRRGESRYYHGRMRRMTPDLEAAIEGEKRLRQYCVLARLLESNLHIRSGEDSRLEGATKAIKTMLEALKVEIPNAEGTPCT